MIIYCEKMIGCYSHFAENNGLTFRMSALLSVRVNCYKFRSILQMPGPALGMISLGIAAVG